MEFQTLRKSHKKEIVIGACLFIILAIILITKFAFAKYELVKSIKIAEGTINYKVPDFKIIAMYKNDGNGYVEIDTMPESGYAINESKSYCELNGSKDSNARVYTDEDGQHIISAITKGSRCYIYFDNYKKVNTALGEITVKLSTPDFSKTSCSSGCGESTVGIYQAKDDDGWSYYYRGDVEDNYVKFANFYWRIIRINGDGSIRLIYDGTSLHANGEETTDSIAVANVKFNDRYDDNAYVGFKYTVGEAHGLGTKSNALQQLETWYTNNLASYAAKIDTNAGFCGDRMPSTVRGETNGEGGIGSTTTYYGGYIRLLDSTGKWNITQISTLKCKNSDDLFTNFDSIKGDKSLTYPIGLITADEVINAGGFAGKENVNFYLNNGQDFWSLTPSYFSSTSGPSVFHLLANGNLNSWSINHEAGIRPVINLKADTIFSSGNGTMNSPYVVS